MVIALHTGYWADSNHRNECWPSVHCWCLQYSAEMLGIEGIVEIIFLIHTCL